MKPVKRTIQANSKGEDGRSARLNLRLPRFLNVARGSVLIVTMWIVLVLAGLVLVFSRSMRVEAIASANYVSAVQADTIARGALQYVQAKFQRCSFYSRKQNLVASS